MAIPESPPGKSLLRSTLRRTLREQTPSSANARAALENWLAGQPGARTIALYSALPGEVDLSPLPRSRADLKWVYPKVAGDHLTFHPAEDLRPGAFGILEPAAGSPEIPLHEIDVFICPGLAFDPQGHRLGRGRGFYDRMLARARPDALKIGVCFPFQIVPDTFPEGHDVRMDEVLF